MAVFTVNGTRELTEEQCMSISSAFFANAEDESQANNKYATMLSVWGHCLEERHVKRVKEFMADENNHNLGNIEMAVYYGTLATTPDGLKEFLNGIAASGQKKD